ncbi:putative YfrE protein [Vibrio sinaloensis DSM 21326]|uniref:Putative YfrE protein n=1 Tax=Vibrio sinaloensis DSM 21326 TaxID=945550 RepID=E8M9K2_PHOS4|nr:putative YfrE protein [Vibrio sinaloensis DSM 21326]
MHIVRKILLVSVVVSVPLFWWLKGSPPPQPEALQSLPSHSEQIREIQGKLKQDPNQAELWFQLGHGYLNQQDFGSALTCFDYAIRLTESPTASQYAAKATALYYSNKQQLTDEVQQLLALALAEDENNLTALSLIASDHFISFRYQQAIDVWTQMLDSQDQDLDRASIIHSLNLAKQMQNKQ